MMHPQQLSTSSIQNSTSISQVHHQFKLLTSKLLLHQPREADTLSKTLAPGSQNLSLSYWTLEMTLILLIQKNVLNIRWKLLCKKRKYEV